MELKVNISHAIYDHNVLGFSIEYIQTFKGQYDENDKTMVEGIDTDEVYLADERIELVSNHIINNHKMDKESQFLHALYPIIYSKKPLLSDIKACFYTDPTKDMLTVMNKSSDWSYEEEYRLFCPANFNQDYFMPILPSRIFLGLNIKTKDQDKIIKFARKYCIEIRKWKLMQARLTYLTSEFIKTDINLKDNSQNLILWNKLFLHFVALFCTRGEVDAVGSLGGLLQKI